MTSAACWPLGPTTMPARRRQVEFDLIAFAQRPEFLYRDSSVMHKGIGRPPS